MFAVDLLGFGASDKVKEGVEYELELWRDLLVDFMQVSPSPTQSAVNHPRFSIHLSPLHPPTHPPVNQSVAGGDSLIPQTLTQSTHSYRFTQYHTHRRWKAEGPPPLSKVGLWQATAFTHPPIHPLKQEMESRGSASLQKGWTVAGNSIGGLLTLMVAVAQGKEKVKGR